MNIRRELYQSLVQKYESEIQEFKTTLMIFFEQSVGIGDHSTGDFHDNLDEALNQLVDAEDRLETLKRYFIKEEDVKET